VLASAEISPIALLEGPIISRTPRWFRRRSVIG
jgi:hypothetical protein